MAVTNGPVFTRLQERLGDKAIAGELLEVCSTTVDKLLAEQTESDKPGMLLGKIQSGKTKAFIGVLAIAFDSGYDHAIIFTKGTKALARQTLARLRDDLRIAIDDEYVYVHDIMELPDNLTPWDLERKLIFVCKKEDDNLNALTEVITEKYPELATKKLLLIDDEADLASIGFRRRAGTVEANVIPGQINNLRENLEDASYLLVTATPYALYLQPEGEIEIPADSAIFLPTRPAFTELVPPHAAYIGGEFYFEQSSDPASVAYFLHVEVPPAELAVLRTPNSPNLDLATVLTSPAINGLRRAIITFIVGGMIRRWQFEQAGQPKKRYSFLVHTETSNAAHAWQSEIVSAILNRLRQQSLINMAPLAPLIQAAYDDLSQSVALAGTAMPPMATITADFPAALNMIAVETVNKESDLDQLLDMNGQLELRNPLNIFIGGNILDRGITIDRVIGFYYGRNPRRSQQDTVLQHARMYGARAQEDLAVTRFYTTADIRDRMDMIHQFDSALRTAFEQGGHAHGVVFLRRAPGNQLIPCSPNKILLSAVTTLRSNGRLIPVGFSTNAETLAAVHDVNGLLAGVDADPNAITYTLPLAVAEQIIDRVAASLTMDGDREYDFTAMKAAMAYLATQNNNPGEGGQVACLVRRGRNDAKVRPDGRLQDAPNSPADLAAIAPIRGGRPALFLYLENGETARGWNDCAFYWPLLLPPPGTSPVIFTAQTGN